MVAFLKWQFKKFYGLFSLPALLILKEFQTDIYTKERFWIVLFSFDANDMLDTSHARYEKEMFSLQWKTIERPISMKHLCSSTWDWMRTSLNPLQQCFAHLQMRKRRPKDGPKPFGVYCISSDTVGGIFPGWGRSFGRNWFPIYLNELKCLPTTELCYWHQLQFMPGYRRLLLVGH